jgi:hypothetical protein
MVPVIVCRACGGLTSSARFSYLCECLLCEQRGAENPQTNVRAVQTRDIFVRFTTAGGCSVQAVDLNLDRMLGPRVPVTSPEVLRRLLACLGANREALREYDRSHQSHGKGSVRITSGRAARTCCACTILSCLPRDVFDTENRDPA